MFFPLQRTSIFVFFLQIKFAFVSMGGFHGTTGFGRLISLLVYSVLMKFSFYEAISLPFLFLVPHRDDMEYAYVGVQNVSFLLLNLF